MVVFASNDRRLARSLIRYFGDCLRGQFADAAIAEHSGRSPRSRFRSILLFVADVGKGLERPVASGPSAPLRWRLPLPKWPLAGRDLSISASSVSPAFRYETETNAYAENVSQTRKEHVLWIEVLRTRSTSCGRTSARSADIQPAVAGRWQVLQARHVLVLTSRGFRLFLPQLDIDVPRHPTSSDCPLRSGRRPNGVGRLAKPPVFIRRRQ